MAVLTAGWRSKTTRRFFAQDHPVDVVHVAALFVVYGISSATTRIAADVDDDELERSVLLIGAIVSNPVPFAALLVAASVAVLRWRSRLWAPWSALEHGRVLRNLAMPAVFVLAWQGSLYDYNFVLGRWHAADRLLVVALALACVVRPVFLVPFALQSRIIADQFDSVLQTRAAQNIDALLVMALVAIAAAHLWFVVTGRSRTAPVLLVLFAALAAHFFVPGKSKLAIDWLPTTDMSNLPLSGYTAGWLGQGSGEWARHLSDVLRPLNRTMLLGTQIFELGAVVAVLHHRVFRLWLPFCVVFHTVIFAATGFWFGSWVVLEISLLILLTRRQLQPWISENATPARAVITVAAVVLGGSALFHPPGLAWLDAPVSYGYRIEAITAGGSRSSLPVAAFAPFEQELAFARLRLGPTEPLSAGYGAVASVAEYRSLQTLDSFAEIDARELPSDPELVRRSQRFVQRFLEHVNEHGAPPWWSVLSPPDHFWTGSPSPQVDLDEPIERLEFYLITAIHDHGEPRYRRQLVLTAATDNGGRAIITFPEITES